MTGLDAFTPCQIYLILLPVAESQNLSELQLRWNGLYQITDVVSDWEFVVKHLVTKAEKTLHGSRLQFYLCLQPSMVLVSTTELEE